jgi:capsular polysaccharide export protein
MNVAYLDPAYSRYFHELAGRLAARTGGSAVALLSSPAYRQYTETDRTIVWAPGRMVQPRRLPADFELAPWAPTHDADAMAVFSHAVAWFVERFRQEAIDLCLVFSDARPFSLAAALAAEEAGVVLLYFERGAFRLGTSSISTQGLNARFSLKQAQAQTRITGVSADAPLPRRAPEPWLRTRFARFVLRNALACLFEHDRARIQHKRYAIGHYVRLAASQWWAEHHHRRVDPAETAGLTGRKVVVVPLQLPSDSQLMLYSPFHDNQAFIDFVCTQVHAVAPDAVLLFKRHPMDAAGYRLPAGARWVGGNLARLDKLQPVVVCINSNVGFESLVRGLRVIGFAPSFYADAPSLLRATVADFAARYREALARNGDAAAGAALRAAVLRWYQAPGDAWAFTAEDIEQTFEIVLQHYRAARIVLAPQAGEAPPLRAVGAADPAIA